LGLSRIALVHEVLGEDHSPSGFTRLARFAKARDIELRDLAGRIALPQSLDRDLRDVRA
jgi:hypothetical protein